MKAKLTIEGLELQALLEAYFMDGMKEESGREWTFDWKTMEVQKTGEGEAVISVTADYSEIF